eukprot:428815_1
MSNDLSNSDFRKFFREPAPDGETDAPRDGGQGEFWKRRKSSKGSQRWRQMKKNQEEGVEDKKSQYRNRFKEMQDGSNPDYLDKTITFENMDMETTKYLGGDEAHTHMVKGLDFILLNRVRNKMDDSEDTQLEAALAKKKEAERKRLKKAASSKKKFRTVVGRNVHNFLFPDETRSSVRKSEVFRPGRMIFEFDLDPRNDENIPTTLIHSKADCPHYEDSMFSKLPPSILESLQQIFKSGKKRGKRSRAKSAVATSTDGGLVIRAGHERRESKKKDGKNEAKKVIKPSEDEEDIFEGAGAYIFQPKSAKDGRANPYSKKGASARSSKEVRAPHVHRDRADRISSSHRDRDRDHHSDRHDRSRVDDRRNRHEKSRDDRFMRPRDLEQRRDSQSFRDSSEESGLKSILKKPVGLVDPTLMGSSAQVGLSKSDKRSLRERLEAEKVEDPFGIADISVDADRRTVTGKVQLGAIARAAHDPYGLDWSVAAGEAMDDDDSDDEGPSRKKRRSEVSNKQTAQRAGKRKFDQKWDKVQRLMKKKF